MVVIFQAWVQGRGWVHGVLYGAPSDTPSAGATLLYPDEVDPQHSISLSFTIWWKDESHFVSFCYSCFESPLISSCGSFVIFHLCLSIYAWVVNCFLLDSSGILPVFHDVLFLRFHTHTHTHSKVLLISPLKNSVLPQSVSACEPLLLRWDSSIWKN